MVVADFSSPPNTVDASIRADNSGVPGIRLESFSFTGDLGDGNAPTTLLFNSTLHPPLLSGQQYWIAVTSGNANNAILWKNNSVGDDRNAMLDFGSDNTWEATNGADPAFRVIGIVPEPAMLAPLVLLSLARPRR